MVVDRTRDTSTRDAATRIERETRCYLTSSPLGADRLVPAIRQHRAIENGLHWILDVAFHDDQSRIRTAHAPENMKTVRHIAVTVAARKKRKDSMRLARKTAGWDDDYLVRLVAP
nr:ISAs1 family transposase [Methylobacterium sp. ap11]